MDESVILEVKSLCSGYESGIVLRDVSLHVDRGEIVCLLGANGAGKTTLLRTISGLLEVKEGEVFFLGKDIRGSRPHTIARLGISHVPEGRQIFTELTVLQNLLIGTYRRNMKKREILELLEYCVELFPILKERRNQKAGALSGGEQQMLAIARALMSRPTLLLLDEPSLGLAPLVVDKIMEVISGLKKRGLSILMVEQNVDVSLDIADRAYILRTGRIVIEGTAQELKANEDIKRSYLGV